MTIDEDLSLSAPILVLVAGQADDEVGGMLENLANGNRNLKLSASHDLQLSIEQQKMGSRDTLTGTFVKCVDLSQFMALRDRLVNETLVLPLKCYSILIVIDVFLNKNRFGVIREQTKLFLKMKCLLLCRKTFNQI